MLVQRKFRSRALTLSVSVLMALVLGYAQTAASAMPEKLQSAVRAASSDGRYWGTHPNGDRPSSGTDLVTLNPALSGTAGYRYWDQSATYEGAFRVPNTENTGTDVDFFYAYPTLGLTSVGKMLLGGHSQGDANKRIAEINIPSALSTSSTLTALPIATFSTQFFYPVDNAPVLAASWGLGARIGGIKSYNGRVMINVYPYYNGEADADKTTAVLNDVNAPGISGMRGFFAATGIAHSSYWISEIPAGPMRTALGGTHIFGSSNGNTRSIEARNSMGPTAFIYDADASDSIVGATPPTNGSSITATPLLDFPPAIKALNNANLAATGQAWTHMSEAYYGFVVPNTDTYMVLGFSGGHSSGTDYYDPAPPWGGEKGYGPVTQSDVDNHYWLFKVSDLAKVKNGTLTNPYDVDAYEHGRIVMPFEGTKLHNSLKYVMGGDFDTATGKLYLSIQNGDTSQGAYGALPVILRYDLSGVTD